ncbi:ejaculatory bulb-specific protein 3-like [Macrosteles quadrilineatus]|uniref:ejaculatory bulb-specific protein 3-like n=1 Tax=Macrosteles quadrilineatus TaxID=74068 RepID=UPI0023E28493|nr:ejaculatory bulb-specific protein 3-like [Macrosteles quadrilineatus]
MTSSATLCAAVLLCACVVSTHAQRAYTNKYDNLDLDKILSSKRLVNNYVQCLTDRKPCSPEGQELKRALPDAIKTKCAKCSESQKDKAIKVIRKMQKDYPQEWKTLMDKWDPSGKLMKEFEQEAQKRAQG